MIRLAIIIVLLCVAACKAEDQVQALSYSTANRANAPVALLREQIVEGSTFPNRVVSGGNADGLPRVSGGTLFTTPPPDPVQLAMTWIEISTGRAYAIETEVDLKKFH